MASKATVLVNADSAIATDIITVRGSKLIDIDVYDETGGAAFSATVTLQRKKSSNDGSTAGQEWRDIETYTSDTQKTARNSSIWDMRLICKSGSYTTGEIRMTLEAGNRE